MKMSRCRPSCRPATSPGSSRASLKWDGAARFQARETTSFPPGLIVLKLNLLNHALRTFCEPHFRRPLRLAAEKAARLAAESGFPMLLFPELFMELAIPAMVESEYRLCGGFRFASAYQ